MPLSMYSYLAIALASILPILMYLKKRIKRFPLPPGPKPLPLIGNMFDMPSEGNWRTYDKWFKEFDSDIVHVNLAGTHIVILKTYEAAVELLEKRSTIYSSRIQMTMANELMGWGFGFFSKPYGHEWRAQRRIVDPAFNINAVRTLESQLKMCSIEFLLRHIAEPVQDVIDQIRHMAGQLIISMTYGMKVQPDADPFVTLMEKNLNILGAATQPGAFWVDVFPALKHLPVWFPGAGFHRKAKAWKVLVDKMRDWPFEVSKKLMRDGELLPCFVSQCLDKLDNKTYGEGVIRDAAAIMYAGGIDTFSATIGTLILALTRYPDVQKKAQVEIDLVLKGSLPTLHDQEALPYITALVLETLRWKPVTPFGLPHCVTNEDIYEGYRIPAGSMVVANVWSTFHDEGIYPEPERFNPDRFLKDGKLNPDVLDPRLLAFGFGRRICPGRHLALSFIWLTTALMLATMEISRATDKCGNVIERSEEYSEFLVNKPKSVVCDMQPRSAQAEELLRSALSGQ